MARRDFNNDNYPMFGLMDNPPDLEPGWQWSNPYSTHGGSPNVPRYHSHTLNDWNDTLVGMSRTPIPTSDYAYHALPLYYMMRWQPELWNYYKSLSDPRIANLPIDQAHDTRLYRTIADRSMLHGKPFTHLIQEIRSRGGHLIQQPMTRSGMHANQGDFVPQQHIIRQAVRRERTDDNVNSGGRLNAAGEFDHLDDDALDYETKGIRYIIEHLIWVNNNRDDRRPNDAISQDLRRDLELYGERLYRLQVEESKRVREFIARERAAQSNR
jgi:hypothetical protein